MKALLAKSVPALQERSQETHKILLNILAGSRAQGAIAKAA
jgi:hypothetical protein